MKEAKRNNKKDINLFEINSPNFTAKQVHDAFHVLFFELISSNNLGVIARNTILKLLGLNYKQLYYKPIQKNKTAINKKHCKYLLQLIDLKTYKIDETFKKVSAAIIFIKDFYEHEQGQPFKFINLTHYNSNSSRLTQDCKITKSFIVNEPVKLDSINTRTVDGSISAQVKPLSKAEEISATEPQQPTINKRVADTEISVAAVAPPVFKKLKTLAAENFNNPVEIPEDQLLLDSITTSNVSFLTSDKEKEAKQAIQIVNQTAKNKVYPLADTTISIEASALASSILFKSVEQATIALKDKKRKIRSYDIHNPSDIKALVKSFSGPERFKFVKSLAKKPTKVKLRLAPVSVLGDQIGLFAAQDLSPSSTPFAYYAGERRYRESEEQDQGNLYIAEVPSKDGVSMIHIDAKKKRNETAFINSSATANIRAFIDGEHMAFRVIKPIKQGEQVLFDYGDNYYKNFDYLPYYLHASDNSRSDEQVYKCNETHYSPDLYQFDESFFLQFIKSNTCPTQNHWLVPKLMLAIAAKDADLVENLLRSGHPVELLAYQLTAISATNKNNLNSYAFAATPAQPHLTPLMLACYIGDKRCINLLLKYDADPERCLLITGYNSLMLLLAGHAATKTIDELWLCLFKNIKNRFILTHQRLGLLHFAMQKNVLPLVQALIQKAESNEQDIFESMLLAQNSEQARPMTLDECLKNQQFELLELILNALQSSRILLGGKIKDYIEIDVIFSSMTLRTMSATEISAFKTWLKTNFKDLFSKVLHERLEAELTLKANSNSASFKSSTLSFFKAETPPDRFSLYLNSSEFSQYLRESMQSTLTMPEETPAVLEIFKLIISALISQNTTEVAVEKLGPELSRLMFYYDIKLPLQLIFYYTKGPITLQEGLFKIDPAFLAAIKKQAKAYVSKEYQEFIDNGANLDALYLTFADWTANFNMDKGKVPNSSYHAAYIAHLRTAIDRKIIAKLAKFIASAGLRNNAEANALMQEFLSQTSPALYRYFYSDNRLADKSANIDHLDRGMAGVLPRLFG